MADIPWYNFLPTNIATGAGDAQKAFSQAGEATQNELRAGTTARSAAYDLALKQTVEALMAHATGPNGVDKAKFYQLAAGTPYGVSAIKAYADTVFPQAQKEQGQRAALQVLNPDGSVGGVETAKAMRENPDFAGTTLATAMDLQKNQFGNASEIAKNRATVQSLSPGAWASQPTTAPTAAQPGSIGGNAGMQVQLPTDAGGGYKGDFSVDEYAKRSPQDQAALRRGLIGVSDELDNPITEKSSPASIASAVRRLQAMQFAAGLPGTDPRDPLASVEKRGAAMNAAPATGLKAVQDAIARGYSLAGTNLSQKGAALSVQGSEQAQYQVAKLRKAGFDANPSNASLILEKKATFDWLKNTSDDIHELRAEATKGKVDNDLFNSTISALSNAPMVAESITNLAGEHRFFENLRTDPSLGALIKSSDGNPVHFIQSLGSAKLGAQSQEKVLSILGNIVDTQLKTGKAKSDLDQFRLHWSKATTKPAEAKADPLGIRK